VAVLKASYPTRPQLDGSAAAGLGSRITRPTTLELAGAVARVAVALRGLRLRAR
jgi:hypothetical protein